MIAAVWHVTSLHGFRTGWQGIPVYFLLAGVLGRFANPKVILRANELIVVNPLTTFVIPRGSIYHVSIGDDGGLEVQTEDGDTISIFSFSGSVIDDFVGRSREAVRIIRLWLESGNYVGESKPGMQRNLTRCLPADISLLICCVVSAAGGVWMAFGGV